MIKRRQRVGELRPSQMLFSYGPGALVDLPRISVMVLGLDDWDQTHAERVEEPRLLEAVRRRLGPQLQALRSPPRPEEEADTPFDEAALVGVPVAPFPRWMICPRCRTLAPLSLGVFEPKGGWKSDHLCFVHTYCTKAKNPEVVPARFLVACRRHHLDDFPWSYFVHRGAGGCPGDLRLAEIGPSGEARDVQISCTQCRARRRMAEAFGRQAEKRLPCCRGRRAHLKDTDPDACDEPLRAILMGASNLWFADNLTALSIPLEGSRLEKLVDELWPGLLEHVETEDQLRFLLKTETYRKLWESDVDEVWEIIDRRRHREADHGEGEVDLKGPEWKVFLEPEAAPQGRDFELHQVSVPSHFTGLIKDVCLAERLREVRALTAFTRIDHPQELAPENGERSAPLSRTRPAWVPASEVRGEGIFLRFREERIAEWLERPEIDDLDRRFHESHRRWRQVRNIVPAAGGYPGIRYVLLHTISHALIRELALECGYSAASIRERIYSRSPSEEGGPMAGILIYTAAPDSEGTLGGLYRLGYPEELGRHLRGALRKATLCTSDPLCAEHPPSTQGRTIHGAACHACLFAPETSCEAGNRYLDRSVLVDTVEKQGLALFLDDQLRF